MGFPGIVRRHLFCRLTASSNISATDFQHLIRNLELSLKKMPPEDFAWVKGFVDVHDYKMKISYSTTPER